MGGFGIYEQMEINYIKKKLENIEKVLSEIQTMIKYPVKFRSCLEFDDKSKESTEE